MPPTPVESDADDSMESDPNDSIKLSLGDKIPLHSGSQIYLLNPLIADATYPDRLLRPLLPSSFLVRLIYPLPHEYATGEVDSGRQALQFWHDALPDIPHLIQGLVVDLIFALLPNVNPETSILRKQIVTVRVMEFDGLARTHNDTIEISLSWLRTHAARAQASPAGSPADSTAEFTGVLIHELVHIYQFDGCGTAPWWFIEGLADFIRYECNLGAAHWDKMGSGDSWTQGYQVAGMFFAWIEAGPTMQGTEVTKKVMTDMNQRLQKERWLVGQDDRGEGGWWKEMTGYDLKQLWATYKESHAPQSTSTVIAEQRESGSAQIGLEKAGPVPSCS